MASEKLLRHRAGTGSHAGQPRPLQFGQQCLIARRLIEAGVPFVKVARAWWDSHARTSRRTRIVVR